MGKEPVEEEMKTLTLDEWKAQQKKEGPKFNTRKAGEGSDIDPKWKKATSYKKINEEEEEETVVYPQRANRQKKLDINFTFADQDSGRGGGRGRGRGRGGEGGDFRRDRQEGDRPPRQDGEGPPRRGGDRGRGRGGDRGGRGRGGNKQEFNLDQEAFPTLG